MKIIDKNGQIITITDLDHAIQQAEQYSNFVAVSPKTPEFIQYVQSQSAYWKHMLNELQKLKNHD